MLQQHVQVVSVMHGLCKLQKLQLMLQLAWQCGYDVGLDLLYCDNVLDIFLLLLQGVHHHTKAPTCVGASVNVPQPAVAALVHMLYISRLSGAHS